MEGYWAGTLAYFSVIPEAELSGVTLPGWLPEIAHILAMSWHGPVGHVIMESTRPGNPKSCGI